MSLIDAWVTSAAQQPMTRERVDLGPIGAEEVEYCGPCHSDLSMFRNDWGIAQYPAVLGHEAIGRVVEVGFPARRPARPWRSPR